MIIHLKKGIDKQKVNSIADSLQAIIVSNNGKAVLVTSYKLKSVQPEIEAFVDSYYITDSDMQLSSRDYLSEKRMVEIGNLQIGGNTNNTLLITGPCSVESEEQIFRTAEYLTSLGVSTIRGGCFKPRTSPYSFQGLGLEGLKLLAGVREKYGLKVATEVKDATHVEQVIEYADIIQVGAKAMYDQGILRKCGKANKPILLKRGFGSTLQEFVQAAEFILSGGNNQVILCERGIRTFETKTRFTLDLCGVAYLKRYTNLPVIVDPSHAMGQAYGVPELAQAAMAMGVDGLLIETHPNPSVAKSDASQQLNFDQFQQLLSTLKPIAAAVKRNII